MIGMDLSGRTALITGSSQGLGAATARRLSDAGAKVVINYFPDAAGTNARLGLEVAQSLGDSKAIALPADVRSLPQVEAMVDQAIARLGSLDIVVNNAAILRDRTIKKLSAEDWQAVIDTNLTGVFNVCKVAANRMNDGGRIVNLASIAAVVGFFGQANYASAKAGVIGLTRVLSRELARRQITVNAVAPGVVLTEMGQSIPEEVRLQMLTQIPLNRFGEPTDIANAILFLCSPMASYITGQTLHVNGGWWNS